MKSPAKSFEGYQVSVWAKGLLSFRKWLGSTKNSLKTLLMVGVGFAVWYFTPLNLSPASEVLFAALSAAVTKWVADTFDFWFNEVELT